MVKFEIAGLKLPYLGSEPPVPDQPGDGGERLLYSFSCSSLMKACISSISLMF